MKEKQKLEQLRNKWDKQYQSHNNSKITSQLVIKNVFQGDIAYVGRCKRKRSC